MITLDPNTHTYSLDGKPVPGVNQILESVGICDYSRIPDKHRIPALERGKLMHMASEDLFDGVDPWWVDEPSIAGRMSALEKWVEESGFIPRQWEEPMYSSIHGYAGTPDAFGEDRDGLLLPDWKSGQYYPDYPIATAAYLALMEVDSHKVRRCSLLLRDNGTYKQVFHEDFFRDFTVFQNALSIFKWKAAKLRTP